MMSEKPKETIMFEICPSAREKNSQNGLGLISAVFAVALAIFIIWASLENVIGLWTALILCLPVALFIATSRFVFKYGKDYIMGLRIYPRGVGTYFPLQKDPDKMEVFVPFSDIEEMAIEENLEVHRTGRRIKRVNVYRIWIRKTGEEKITVFSEMTNLHPDMILKFRQLPSYILNNDLLPSDKLDLSKMHPSI